VLFALTLPVDSTGNEGSRSGIFPPFLGIANFLEGAVPSRVPETTLDAAAPYSFVFKPRDISGEGFSASLPVDTELSHCG
jgi:hypothetical protein